MLSPRWLKLLRDLTVERGRAALMVAALATSLLGIGTILGAQAILTREISRNYLGTHPASATLEVAGGVDRDLVDRALRQPGIADAEAGDVVRARFKVGEDWRPLLLFVVDDFTRMRLNRVFPQRGAWPPADGTLVIERSAESVLAAGPGGTVLIKTPHGVPRAVPIVGTVHDPGLAPAWQERQGYGYVSRATLAALGEPPILRELRIALRDKPLDPVAIEAAAQELTRLAASRGKRVDLIRIPPPGQHPHQRQMLGILGLLLGFGAMALVLSAVLVATSLAGLLARQVRETGVMKALGARAGQIAGLYVVMVGLLAAGATTLALPAGAGGARSLARVIAKLLNFELASEAIPGWVFGIEAAAGVVVPLLVAAVPIWKASRITVREAMDRYGVAGSVRLPAWLKVLTAIPGSSRVVRLALRNTFRRPGRLALTLGLLASGGAMFMTALNVSQGWERIIGRVYENRRYDVEIRLDAPAAIADRVRRVPGVQAVERWGYSPTAFWRPGRVDVSRTYPDGGHASLIMLAPPPGSDMVAFPLLAGRQLRPDDTDAVVLNHMVPGVLPAARVGQQVALSLAGRPTRWRVVGIVEEVGAAGVAYVSGAAFERAAGTAGRATMLRIRTGASTPPDRADIVRAVDRELELAHAAVDTATPLSELRTAVGEHIAVLIGALLAMAAIMAVVGMLGLTSAMATQVVERTREIAVMKTIGATPGLVRKLVIGEAVFVGLLSSALAVVLALPLTALVGQVVGMLSFRVRLPLVADPGAIAAWWAIGALVAVVATAVPAGRAARVTVVEALAHV